MKTVHRRITRLEDRFGAADGTPRFRVVVCRADWGLALDRDRCIQILERSGFLSNRPFYSLVNLCDFPDGMNAEETERYLQEHAAELCFTRRSKSVRARMT
jgi:hypothetical protein